MTDGIAGLRVGILYFGIIFAVGFVFGVLRTLALEVFSGATRLGAVLVEVPIILSIAWIVCGALMQRWKITRDGGAAIAMGVTALTLLLLAEVGLSLVLTGLSLKQHIALYSQAAHFTGLAGQCFFAALPWPRVRFACS